MFPYTRCVQACSLNEKDTSTIVSIHMQGRKVSDGRGRAQGCQSPGASPLPLLAHSPTAPRSESTRPVADLERVDQNSRSHRRKRPGER